MHRKINAAMRGILEEIGNQDPSHWVDFMPFVVGHLRAMKMAALGGRSPMEVVMGIQPKMPATLAYRLPVYEVGVDEYVKDLLEYLTWTHDQVHERAKELRTELTMKATGGHGGEVTAGDIVLRRKNDKEKPTGTRRFETLAWSELFRVRRKVGENTYELDYLDGSPLVNQFGKDYILVPAKQIVKCDMPELDFELDQGCPRRLEVQDREDHNLWHKGTLEKFGVDGRCFIRYDGEPERRYVDLTKEIYRWITAEQEEREPVFNLSH